MLKRIIDWSVNNKLLVLLFTVAAIAGGICTSVTWTFARRCATLSQIRSLFIPRVTRFGYRMGLH